MARLEAELAAARTSNDNLIEVAHGYTLQACAPTGPQSGTDREPRLTQPLTTRFTNIEPFTGRLRTDGTVPDFEYWYIDLRQLMANYGEKSQLQGLKLHLSEQAKHHALTLDAYVQDSLVAMVDALGEAYPPPFKPVEAADRFMRRVHHSGETVDQWAADCRYLLHLARAEYEDAKQRERMLAHKLAMSATTWIRNALAVRRGDCAGHSPNKILEWLREIERDRTAHGQRPNAPPIVMQRARPGLPGQRVGDTSQGTLGAQRRDAPQGAPGAPRRDTSQGAPGAPRRDAGARSCFTCGDQGHISRDCPQNTMRARRVVPAFATAMQNTQPASGANVVECEEEEEDDQEFEDETADTAATMVVDCSLANSCTTSAVRRAPDGRMVAAPTTMELVYVCNRRQIALLDPGSSINYVTPAALADLMAQAGYTKVEQEAMLCQPPTQRIHGVGGDNEVGCGVTLPVAVVGGANRQLVFAIKPPDAQLPDVLIGTPGLATLGFRFFSHFTPWRNLLDVATTERPALAYDIAPTRTKRDDDEPLHGKQERPVEPPLGGARAQRAQARGPPSAPAIRLDTPKQPPQTRRQQPISTACTTLIVPDGGLALDLEYCAYERAVIEGSGAMCCTVATARQRDEDGDGHATMMPNGPWQLCAHKDTHLCCDDCRRTTIIARRNCLWGSTALTKILPAADDTNTPEPVQRTFKG